MNEFTIVCHGLLSFLISIPVETYSVVGWQKWQHAVASVASLEHYDETSDQNNERLLFLEGFSLTRKNAVIRYRLGRWTLLRVRVWDFPPTMKRRSIKNCTRNLLFVPEVFVVRIFSYFFVRFSNFRDRQDLPENRRKGLSKRSSLLSQVASNLCTARVKFLGGHFLN